MRGPAAAGWPGLALLLASPAAAGNCADWNSERFFASAAVGEVVGCLRAGAGVDARNGDGGTVLHAAARFSPDDAVIRALLDAGADPDQRDDGGRVPLHLAAWKNPSVAVVEALIDAGADPDEPNGRGFTPLLLAARSGSEAVVAALIDAGADPVTVTRLRVGRWPVSRILGSDAVMRRLRASAAEGSAAAQYGLGAIHAEAFGDPRYGARAAAWYRKAAGRGHAKARARLDELVSRRGYTPLHLATVRHSSVVAALRGGADPDARDRTGNTALHLAASGADDPAVLEALVAAGADAGARDDFGDTPLHLAARYGADPAALAVLIAAGADPGARGESGATPLHWAAWNGGAAAVLALVNAGADPNARRSDGATPLHWAAWNDDVSVIPALLDAGADPEARDSIGDSPPYRALRHANLPAFLALSGHARPIMSSRFDVYHRKDALFYVRKNCTGDDIRPRFFLHLVPADRSALPEDRRRSGFDNLDFPFDAHGTLSGGHCVAMRALPDYGIAAIRTGQFLPDGSRTWEAVHRFGGD